MKLSAAFALLLDLRLAFSAAFVPTLSAIVRAPSLLWHPSELSRTFMAHVWKLFGNGIDEGGRPVKQTLLPENATGIVLDIGAGHGHTILYLDPLKVTKYVALEPNELMHNELRTLAATKGFTEAAGNLLVLPYGAEETSLITSALGGAHAADTLVFILTLCSIPDPERTLAALVRDVLRPGGTLLFYEHVLSPRADVAWWQRFWTPVWRRTFDGCCLDRPTHVWVERMGVWKEGSVWGKEGEEEEHLFWHRVGRFVKKD
ncbi:Methyltransferase-like protein 7B [Trametes pubescens]|uniref:Methyltransferase-like protein 7B n=1 Tax=Trametes pubescens TaxID=154538 RepID=A0A1M2VYU1_TRAPU|nr:Methyltransferase-like protein 7B [Trametes pubescens]